MLSKYMDPNFIFKRLIFFQFSPKPKYNKNKAIQLLGLKQLVEKKNIGKTGIFKVLALPRSEPMPRLFLVDLKKCFRDPQAMAKRDN